MCKLLQSGVIALVLAHALVAAEWTANGFVVPEQRVVLTAPAGMVVAQVNVQPGDKVKKGDLLLRGDDRAAKLSLQTAEIGLRRAQLELEAAKALMKSHELNQTGSERALKRLQEMVNAKLADPTNLDDAKIRMEQLGLSGGVVALQIKAQEANLEEARLTLESARLDLESLHFRAPFDGMVVTVGRNIGETTFATGEPVIELHGLRLVVEAAVKSELREQIKAGQTVRVSVSDSKQTVAGTVMAIGPTIDPRTDTFAIRVGLSASWPQAVAGRKVTLRGGTAEPSRK